MNQYTFNRTAGLFIGSALLLGACSKEKVDTNLGSTPTPTFTAVPLADQPNKIVFTSTTEGGFMWSWDFNNGATSQAETDTVWFFDKGDYEVDLRVFTKAGFGTGTQTITIPNDVTGTQLLEGGDMEPASAGDWNMYSAGVTMTTTDWVNGGLRFSNGSGSAQTNVLVWQPIEVQAGKQYRFTAHIEGSGATNSWFEVYIGSTMPTAGGDYSDNNYISMNTWSGCGTSAFNGDFEKIGCAGNGKGKNGLVTFSESGTRYLVLKVGSWDGNLGTEGMTIDDVNFIEI